MNKILFISDNTTNKISYYHLILLMLSLPFDRFYTHLIIISFGVHTLIHFKKEAFKTLFKWDIFILQAVFFITLMNLCYSTNKTAGFNELVKQLTILIIPLLFCLNKFDLRKYKENLFMVFSIGCLLTVLYLYLQALVTIRFYHLDLNALFSTAFTNHNFSEPIGIHATYFAILLSIAFVYFLSLLVNQKNKFYTLILFLFCLILFSGIIQLSSKAVLLGISFVIIFIFPYFLVPRVKVIKFLLLTVSLSLLVALVLYKVDSFKQRYITELGSDLSKTSLNQLSDPRLARWTIALKIAAQSPIIGHGAGTEIALLSEQFYEKKLYQSFLAKLNSHNQYISFLITAGMLGLIAYLYILYFGFRLAFMQKDILFFTFMVLITIVSFSENILFVDKGITFYSLFFALFYFSNQKREIVKIKV
jgi:O-antigen ligase